MSYNCPVCNNKDYEEIDGLFFCTECQTQSQEFLVQQSEVNGHFSYGRKVKTLEARNPSKQKPKVDLGRPWTIYEAYQVIILAQAESLIKQGASEKLKDVVFTIWANYLSKIGVAFCAKEKLVPDIVTKTKFGRRRELHRGTLSNPLNRRKRPLQSNTVQPEAGDANHLTGEQFYAEDDLDADSFYDTMFLNDFDINEEDYAELSIHARKCRAFTSPEWMDMNKTIAICYIGVMFTNPNILACDVIRYIYESKVPFLSVTHLLPQDMVLSANDRSLFETSKFDTSTFIFEINHLLTYLKLSEMPSPKLDDIIPRFVKELCLPGELAFFAIHLIEKIPFLWQNKITRYKRQEVLAMGYIVLAVKIALGLDDSTEFRLSRYSEKLQDLIGAEIKLFVWTNWIKFMIQKRANTFDAYRELTKDISKCKLQHQDQLLECYYNSEGDKRRYTTFVTLNRHQHFVQCLQAEFRASLRKPLEIASERFESRVHLKQNAVQRSQEVWVTMSQEFHLSTMSHIVSISSFKGQVEELYDKTIASASWNYMHIQSVIRSKGVEKVYEGIIMEQRAPEKEAQLEKLLVRYSLPRTDVLQYSLIKKDDNLDSHRHESYLCFLSLVSELVDCSVKELDVFVVHLLNYLISVSNGTVKNGLVCHQFGHSYATKRSRKNVC